MSVIIINPNSTASMTDAMVATAQAAAPEVPFEGWTSSHGPAAIQGEEDGARAAPPLLDLVAKASQQGARGIVIGCFDDTALAEAAGLAACPVVGLGQAAYHHAALRQWRFSVVTTLAASVPVLEKNIERAGLSGYLARVRASDVPVLALEQDPASAERQILVEAQRAEAEDAAQSVILGCAGMVHVATEIGKAINVPVLDPVICAARCMAWLSR